MTVKNGKGGRSNAVKKKTGVKLASPKSVYKKKLVRGIKKSLTKKVVSARANAKKGKMNKSNVKMSKAYGLRTGKNIVTGKRLKASKK